MTQLFDELKIGDLTLKNRILVAPMTRSRASDAGVQPVYAADYYAQRSGAGLIITEATNISAMAKGYVRTSGIYAPEQIAGWRIVAAKTHAAGGKIFMQLFHTGRIALPDFLPAHARPVSASEVRAKGQNYTDGGMKDFVAPRALTLAEIKETINDFATAARNAVKTAGFDGVELHAANGYLLHQFLGTNTNLRTDDYGGTMEKRARFLLDTLDAVSEAVGANRVGVKISPTVPFNDMRDDDAETFYPFLIEELNKRELAYLHVGFEETPTVPIHWHEVLRPLYKGVYFANGGLTKESGAELLAQNKADAIVYGKLFLANPDLPARFAHDAPLNTPDEATFYTPGEKGYTDYPTWQNNI